MSESHPCCASHCCVIHGCKYSDDDCPVVLEKEAQLGACYDCYEDHKDPPPEYDDAHYGCPRCGSSRVIFSGHYDIPKGSKPTMDSPFVRYVLCLTCEHRGQWADFRGHKDRQVRSTVMTNPFQLGHLIEGTIEQDPMTDRYNIRTVDADGKPATFDVQDALAALVGKEVRFTLVTFENLARLAELVESQGGGGRVMGLQAGDIGVPFDTRKKT